MPVAWRPRGKHPAAAGGATAGENPMRSVIAATLAAVATLIAANVIGVAAAPIEQGASAAAARAAYRQGMAGAVADGQQKAEFLAGKAGATLGNVQSIVEGGGWITCIGADAYVEYEGEQPDVGSTSVGTVVPLASGTAGAPTPGRPSLKKRPKHPGAAHKASTSTCSLSATVSLVYAIS